MRHDAVAQDGAWRWSSRRGISRPTRAASAARAGPPRELLTAPDRLTTPLVRDAQGRAAAAGHAGTQALDRIAERACARSRPKHGARRGRRVRRRRPDQREGVPAGQVRPRGAAHRQHRLQRPLLHGVGGGGGLRAFGIDRGLPFPLEDIPGAEAILLAGGNPAETMPPIMQYFEAQRRARRPADRRRSARAPPTARVGRRCTCSSRPGPMRRWPTACCTSRSGDGLIDRDYIDDADQRVRGGAPRRRRLLARSGRAHHRRARRAARSSSAHIARRGARPRWC